jgi:hypothetical protein
MSSIRSSLLGAAACALLVPFTACGGDDGAGNNNPDANNGTGNPEGTHYSYVVSRAYVPSTNAEASMWGLDIGAMKSGTPDGLVDNTLGQAFATLASQGLSVQNTITTAIDQGKILLLIDYQTKDFTTASTSGLQIKIGASSTPPACTDAADTTCRHHLNGDATITLSPSSPSTAAVTGPVAGGTFTSGAGTLALQLAVGSTDPILVSLKNARVKATTASATGITVTLGGALTVTDLNSNILPAIFTTISGIIDHDCPRPRPVDPPSAKCGCAGTTGTIVGLFDNNPRDCEVSAAEFMNSNFIKAVLLPDVCSTATCTAPDALSIGIKVDAVKATF